MASNPPSDITSAIDPWATKYGVPVWLAEDVAFVESGYDPQAVGDQGTSFGLYQLHMGGQLPAQYYNNPQQVFDPSLNASIAMPAIQRGYQTAGPFKDTLAWWEQFAASSGHPGGYVGDPVTKAEAIRLAQTYESMQPIATSQSTAPMFYQQPQQGSSPQNPQNPQDQTGQLLDILPRIVFMLLGAGLIIAAVMLLKGGDIVAVAKKVVK